MAVETDVPRAEHADRLPEMLLPVRPQSLVDTSRTDTFDPDVPQRPLDGHITVDRMAALTPSLPRSAH